MKQAKRPNILMILADDMGAWAMGCAGNTDIQTPHLDALAGEGMRFDNYYCVSPVCSPARASIFTGTIPSCHGVHDWISHGNLPEQEFRGKPVPPQQYIAHLTAFTELLSRNGYVCALSGKWHLGDSLTPQKGFAHWYTIGQGSCDYFRPDIVEDGRREIRTEYVTDLITQDALETLDGFAAQDRPFYLSVHYTAPHSPWDRSQQKKYIWDRYRSTTYDHTPSPRRLHPQLIRSAPYSRRAAGHKRLLRGYYSAITAMDEGIGRLLERLREHGLDENTIVLFTSDNGMNLGHHGLYGKGNATYPPNMFDSSVKVPFLLRYPPAIEKGSVNEALYSHYDIMPTLIDLLGLEGGVQQPLPGKSFAGLFAGQASSTPSGSIVVLGEYGISQMIRSQTFKLVVRDARFYDEFYDLHTDPGETCNRIADPACQPQIEAMRRELSDFMQKYADPAYCCDGAAVTGMGQVTMVTDGREGAFDGNIPYIAPRRARRYIRRQQKKQSGGN